ncbi:unnamed protein product, partial [Phaeothamnion confervicola]
LYVATPLVRSAPLSEIIGADVFLKMEALQPSGSFKDRGMAHLCVALKALGAKKLASLSASTENSFGVAAPRKFRSSPAGGNAGLSVSHVGAALGMAVVVVVPTTTKAIMLDRIRAQGAQVIVHGANWNEADALARRMVAGNPAAKYVSPYDHRLLWEGYATVVDEIAEAGVEPGAFSSFSAFLPAIVASVGGGGLLCGIYRGLQRHCDDGARWAAATTVVAAETVGAASFAAAFIAGKVTRLAAIDSVATSLGALEVTPRALELSRGQPTRSTVIFVHGSSAGSVQVMSDAEAVDACCRFLTDHRTMVEPACGAALAALYSYKANVGGPTSVVGGGDAALAGLTGPIVVIVCGGSGVTVELLQQWRRQLGLPEEW